MNRFKIFIPRKNSCKGFILRDLVPQKDIFWSDLMFQVILTIKNKPEAQNLAENLSISVRSLKSGLNSKPL